MCSALASSAHAQTKGFGSGEGLPRHEITRLTGDLYLSDVGQDTWEEINFQPALSDGGQNYGWNIMEGMHCYLDENCDSTGTILPVAEYSHEVGGCSITGGYIYRGSLFPELTAKRNGTLSRLSPLVIRL